MIEKNRDILSNAIKDMEQRSPDASAWDHIADKLDHLDALAFSEKTKQNLPEHRAPQGTWSRIAAKLPPAAPPFWAGMAGKIIAGVAIIGSVTLAYMFLPQGEEEILPETEAINNPVQIVNNNAPLQAELQDKDAEAAETLTESTAESLELIENRTDRPTAEASHTTFHSPPIDQTGTSPAGMERGTHGMLMPIAMVRLISVRESFTVKKREEVNQPQMVSDYYDPERKKISYKAGAFYAFSRSGFMAGEGMEVPRNLSSGGIDLRIEKNKWSLTSGLEYLGWTEKGDYFVDYERYQLIYSYNYVDSALINTFSGEVTYFTTEKEVFDSVPGQLKEDASYRYRILQVPLLIGYKVFDRGRFSVSIMGGVGFDIRLSGKQYLPVFNGEDASVTEIRTSLQYRTVNNWRVIAGVQAGYRLAPRWEFYLEPSYQQYMKPMYSPENTKSSGLFKVQAGFHFLF